MPRHALRTSSRPSSAGLQLRVAAPVSRRWRRAGLCLLVLLCLLAPAAAKGDGDPASDVLLTQNAFYPYQPSPSPKLEATLDSLLAQTSSAGLPLKVAIIGSREDLGAVPTYFGHPTQYATFLDREISSNKPQPLLVVMPAGLGLANVGPASALTRVSIDTSARTDGLTRTAILATIALARANGHPTALPSTSAAPTTRRRGSPSVVLFGLPVLLLALAGIPIFVHHKRKASR
jgi:hypothetical protein